MLQLLEVKIECIELQNPNYTSHSHSTMYLNSKVKQENQGTKPTKSKGVIRWMHAYKYTSLTSIVLVMRLDKTEDHSASPSPNVHLYKEEEISSTTKKQGEELSAIAALHFSWATVSKTSINITLLKLQMPGRV